MHFVRLATTLLKDEENARENHVIACDCQIFTDLKKITDRLSNKPCTGNSSTLLVAIFFLTEYIIGLVQSSIVKRKTNIQK